ncbi:MAG: hypothetical protein ACXVCY_15425 [Pseudobdellovibrionaceae bacterium]
MSMIKRLSSLVVFLFLSAVILVSFQNCSSGSNNAASNLNNNPSSASGSNPNGSSTNSTSSNSSNYYLGSGSGTVIGSGSNTSTTPGANATTPAPTTPPPPAQSVTIYCASQLQEGSDSTCSSVLMGSFTRGSWYVNGTINSACDNSTSCTWTNVPAGKYSVQAIAVDSQGNNISSNTFSVTVAAKSDPVSGPIRVYCNEGLQANQTATCSAVISQTVVSGSWYVNGNVVADCENKTFCTWNKVPAGTYSVKAVVVDNSGVSSTSNVVTVKVDP